MALFNKLFPGYKTQQPQINENVNISSKKCAKFNTDQIRIILVRECDFRGRKLLFDSDATTKILLEKSIDQQQTKKFVEIRNGFGYLITSKSNSDYHQLCEMIFGSVAMNFRGTYFKIHNLNTPCGLMFTQVFQSSYNERLKTGHSPATSCCQSNQSSFEHSIINDSGTSSVFSEQFSNRSTASDTILVCKRLQSSPLSVPGMLPKISNNNNNNNNSIIVDSGCVGQSFSISPTQWESLPSSSSCKEISTQSLSYSSIKKLLRSSTKSLQNTSISLPNCPDIVLKKNLHRTSKLGLSIIIGIPIEHQEFLVQFLMEHIAILEAFMWRTRQSIELAYNRPQIFVSSMMEISNNVEIWLMNLINGPKIQMNLWCFFSINCDNRISINIDLSKLNEQQTNRNTNNHHNNKSSFINSLRTLAGYTKNSEVKNDFFKFDLSKFLKTENDTYHHLDNNNEEVVIEKFLKEFCELLKAFDVKDKNFFMSTLLTAILTHHLGWVSTIFPSSTEIEKELIKNLNEPYNGLWYQLADLYGAIGHPVKTAQTVITGSNSVILKKILNSLTYFIRYGNIERRQVERLFIENENKYAEIICNRNNCIPKENYKKYEDHLKEILNNSKITTNVNQTSDNLKLVKRNEEAPPPATSTPLKTLSKTKTCNDFSSIIEETRPVTNLVDLMTAPSTSESQKSLKNNAQTEEDKSDVVFVLGEDYKLVGIKNDTLYSTSSNSTGVKRKISTTKRPPPPSLPHTRKFIQNNDDDNQHGQSLSLTSLCLEDPLPHSNIDQPKKPFVRAQSEPPDSERQINESKYQFSQIKFNLRQYPQVLRNYMKSKNIELEGLALGEKAIDKFATVQQNIKLDLSGYESDPEQTEILQTPSNASEMEFTSDMGCMGEIERDGFKDEDDDIEEVKNDVIENGIRIVNVPMPKTKVIDNVQHLMPYSSTVIKGLVDNYIPHMVLQATTCPKHQWDSKLKKDLALNTQHSLLDQNVEEALAIVANIDTWEVQILSSHTYVIDKGSNGLRIGMSQLIANMLESLLQMWISHIPSQYCLMYIEQKLQELYLKSKALAELLLTSEFCNIELLTSTLKIEVNDVPLLMAIASTHTPQVTKKYGLSFQ